MVPFWNVISPVSLLGKSPDGHQISEVAKNNLGNEFLSAPLSPINLIAGEYSKFGQINVAFDFVTVGDVMRKVDNGNDSNVIRNALVSPKKSQTAAVQTSLLNSVLPNPISPIGSNGELCSSDPTIAVFPPITVPNTAPPKSWSCLFSSKPRNAGVYSPKRFEL